MALDMSDIEQVYRAVHTLYTDSNSIPVTEKQAASAWLNEFQRSVRKLKAVACDIYSIDQPKSNWLWLYFVWISDSSLGNSWSIASQEVWPVFLLLRGAYFANKNPGKPNGRMEIKI